MAPRRPSTAGFADEALAREVLTSAAAMERRYLRQFFTSVKATTTDPELLSLLQDIVDGRYIALTPEVEARIARIQTPTADLVAIARQAYARAGRATLKGANLKMSFDITNPRAIDGARRVSAAMITNINANTRQAIRDIVTQVVGGDVPISTAKRMIRQQVGLLPAHAAAVRRYEATLIGAGTPRTTVTKLTDQYADRLLKYRAEMIARTEVARATSWGQKEAWDQARDADLIPMDAQRVWITAADERTCQFCGPMNGVAATLDGVWLTGKGPIEVPTDIHPQCRCTSGLVFPDEVNKADPLGYERWLIRKHSSHDQSSHGNRYGASGYNPLGRSTPGRRTTLEPSLSDFDQGYWDAAIAMGLDPKVANMVGGSKGAELKRFIAKELGRRLEEEHGITAKDAADAMIELNTMDSFAAKHLLYGGDYISADDMALMGNPHVEDIRYQHPDDYFPKKRIKRGESAEEAMNRELFSLLRKHTTWPKEVLRDPKTNEVFLSAERVSQGGGGVLDARSFRVAAIKEIGRTKEGREALRAIDVYLPDNYAGQGSTVGAGTMGRYAYNNPRIPDGATQVTLQEVFASRMVQGWAESSGSLRSGVMEQAVLRTIPGAHSSRVMGEENGLAVWGSANSATEYGAGKGASNAAEAAFLNSPALARASEALVSSQYSMTQDFYSRQGITEVQIARGVRIPPGEAPQTGVRRTTLPVESVGPVEVSAFVQDAGGRALSSWAVDVADPINFASAGMSGRIGPESALMVASVPVERIFATPFTGIGCMNESEVIFIQKQGDQIPIIQLGIPDVGGPFTNPSLSVVTEVLDSIGGVGSFVGAAGIRKKVAYGTVYFDLDIEEADWPKRTFDFPFVTDAEGFRDQFGLDTDAKVKAFIKEKKDTPFWRGVPNKIKTGLLKATVSKHMRGKHNQQHHAGYSALGRAATGKMPRGGVALTPEVEENLGVRVRPDLRGVVAFPGGRVVDGENTGLYAIGYDSKMRKQYVYSADKQAGQSVKKFARIKKAAKDVKKLDKNLAEEALTDDTAAATLLMRKLGMRPGSTAETRAAKQAFGATTLEARHVKLNPTSKTVSFAFTGKSGVSIRLRSKDPGIYAAMERRLAGKSGRDRLFATSGDRVNRYVKSKMGSGYSGKDLRTLKATTMALQMVKRKRRPTSQAAFKKARNVVGDTVAKQLGNTRAESLRSYIDPAVFAPWEAQL